MTANLKNIVLAVIIATVCALMGAVVILPAFGFPIDPGMSATVTTAFIGMVGTAAGWLAKSDVADAKSAAVFAQQRATIAELKAEGR